MRGRIVFGLAEQVGGDPVGIVLAVGDHEDFARPGDHVDPDHAVKLALGFGDIGIAGAGDDIDRADPLGAIGERADRLRAADRARSRRRPPDVRGGEHQFGLISPLGVGVQITSRSTPATCAGIAFISSEEG